MKNILPATILSAFLALTGCMGHEETAEMEAVYSGSQETIVQEFLDDEKAATAKYVDQVVEITGPIMEINKTDGTITGVKISSDDMYIVNCTFQTPVSDINGEAITVKGVCSGFLGDAESMLPGGTPTP